MESLASSTISDTIHTIHSIEKKGHKSSGAGDVNSLLMPIQIVCMDACVYVK